MKIQKNMKGYVPDYTIMLGMGGLRICRAGNGRGDPRKEGESIMHKSKTHVQQKLPLS